MKSKNNITFVIFAFNEEKRIAYSIRNFINYGEVVVIDNFSSDRTVEISEGL
jgi:glycosyltransferase involved in cell wall biosynthesis